VVSEGKLGDFPRLSLLVSIIAVIESLPTREDQDGREVLSKADVRAALGKFFDFIKETS
jgi:hypothetical protein